MSGYIPKIMKQGAEITSPSLIADVILTNNTINQQESIRQSQEAERQTNTTNAINAANTATTNANNAATNANTIAENVSNAETIRQNFYNAYRLLEDYSSSKSYIVGNKVKYQGGTYQCIVNTTGNAPSYNTDNTWWVCIAAKGTDGAGGDMFKNVYDTGNKNADVYNSSNHDYDNSTSGLDSTNTKDAIDEVATNVKSILNVTNKFEQGIPSMPTYNYTPNDGKLIKLIHGDDSNPTTDGTTPSVYIQRYDQSVTVDDPGHLIPALYTVFKRKQGGTGWLYSNLAYMQDDSNTGNAQSVATAGMAYANNNSKVWGVYGDAYSFNSNATITGGEFDAQNYSGVDYVYNQANPTLSPFSCAVWAMSFGTKNNSFGIGIGGTNTAMWGCGLYFQQNSIKDIALDVQAKPPVVLKLRGASNDGKNSIPGGIGIDFSSNAFYGQGANQGVIHIWNHDICFGPTGLGKIRFNDMTGSLEFWYNGARRGYLDCGGTDHAI